MPRAVLAPAENLQPGGDRAKRSASYQRRRQLDRSAEAMANLKTTAG